MGFSFVHAADLHLDSPFKGLDKLDRADEFVIEALRNATFKAFDNLIDLCLREAVDFLLVAGDAFDCDDHSLRAQLRFRDGLRGLAEAGIKSYVVHGNHDPINAWSVKLNDIPGVHVFGEEVQSVSFEKDGIALARIHGASYPSRRVSDDFGSGFQREGDEPFQIGLFHCNVGGQTGHEPYAPRSVEELRRTGLDYWALGHIHKRMVFSREDPFIGYSGCVQGRHAREDGERGCLLVSVGDDGRMEAEPEFISLEAARWETMSVALEPEWDLDDLVANVDSLFDALRAEAGEKPVVVRLELTGAAALHSLISRPEGLDVVEERLEAISTSRDPFIWVESVRDHSRPELNLDEHRGGEDFIGDLLSIFDECRNDADELTGLEETLAALVRRRSQPETVREMVSREALMDLLDEAEFKCVELLLGE